MTLPPLKPIVFSKHALANMLARGANREEVEQAIRAGEFAPAKGNRISYRKNFPHDAEWKNKHYAIKQVMPIVVAEAE